MQVANHIKISLAILGIGTICAAGIIESGEAERRRIETANRPPAPAAVYEVWTEPDDQLNELVSEDAPPYLGDFRITVYTPHCDGGIWQYQTATGATSQHLATCAVDPDVIPLGTVLDIGGELVVTAVDTGSAVQGNVIDVFYDGTRQEALEWIAGFGDEAPVWVREEAKR